LGRTKPTVYIWGVGGFHPPTEDFTKSNEFFDFIFDAVGKISYSKSKKALKPEGKYVSVVASGHAKMETEDLIFLTKLVEAGKLKPVIDKCYPLEQMAGELGRCWV